MEYEGSMVSVIIPVYNVKNYLDDCINSLLHQTYSYFEAILVDDGSFDGSSELCDKWAEIDGRIRVIHKKNAGVSSARNMGLNIARGEFIAFLDSDDMYSPDFLEEGLNAIRTYKTELFVCRYNDVPENTRYEDLQMYDKNEGASDVIGIDDFWKKYRTAQKNELISIIVVWSKLYRREIFEDLRFLEGIIHEDEAILHCVIDKCNSIAYSEKAKYYYRKAKDSIMQSQFSVHQLDISVGLFNQLSYFSSKGDIDTMYFAWGRGTRSLLKGYQELNRNDSSIMKKLNAIRLGYCRWALYIRKNTGSIKIKAQMWLFNYCFGTYRLLQKIKGSRGKRL